MPTTKKTQTDPIFFGIKSYTGFTEACVATEEATMVEALVAYAKDVEDGKESSGKYWSLVYLIDGQQREFPVRDWWECTTAPSDDVVHVPRFNAEQIKQHILYMLETKELTKGQRCLLLAAFARILSHTQNLTVLEKARIGGILLEIDVFESMGCPLAKDPYLKDMLNNVVAPINWSLIRGTDKARVSQKHKHHEPEGTNNPKPARLINRLELWLERYPEVSVFSFGMTSRSTRYVMLVWKRENSVLAIAECLRSDGGKAYVFEAPNMRALDAFIRMRPRRDALAGGAFGVQLLEPVVHGCSGNWQKRLERHVQREC